MINYDLDALEYISKLCDGHLRDAITLMDKCLAYSKELTLAPVVKALGTIDYDVMFQLSDCILRRNKNYAKDIIEIVENIFNDGKDIKLFVKQYLQFLLDIQKYGIGCDWKYLQIPRLNDYEKWLNELNPEDYDRLEDMLDAFIKLNADIKWSSTPKYDLEAVLMVKCR